MKASILVVEDEPGVALIVSDLLSNEGYTVEVANDGPTGMARMLHGRFDLLILDVMLPGSTGIDICHRARENGFDGGILMLTARSQVPDRVLGLRTGADDYVVKPFAPDELLARVAALLRRVHKEQLTPVMRFDFGGITADFSRREFFKNNSPVNLTAKEADLLRLLVNHRGQTVSRDTILAQVWPGQTHISSRTVDVHIAWLRQKLEENPETPKYIQTDRGRGYRFAR